MTNEELKYELEQELKRIALEYIRATDWVSRMLDKLKGKNDGNCRR